MTKIKKKKKSNKIPHIYLMSSVLLSQLVFELRYLFCELCSESMLFSLDRFQHHLHIAFTLVQLRGVLYLQQRHLIVQRFHSFLMLLCFYMLSNWKGNHLSCFQSKLYSLCSSAVSMCHHLEKQRNFHNVDVGVGVCRCTCIRQLLQDGDQFRRVFFRFKRPTFQLQLCMC